MRAGGWDRKCPFPVQGVGVQVEAAAAEGKEWEPGLDRLFKSRPCKLWGASCFFEVIPDNKSEGSRDKKQGGGESQGRHPGRLLGTGDAT